MGRGGEMKKKTKVLIVFAIILCIGNIGRNIIEFGAISAYLLNNSSLDAKNLTGIDFSKGEKIVEVYDMGGFPLDGMKFEAWRFDREYIVSLREGFFEENGWKRCPVSDAMRETLYGCETEGDIYCTSEFTYPYDKENCSFRK